MANLPRSVVPKGTIRRIIAASRKERTFSPSGAGYAQDGRGQARTEIAAMPVFDIAAGRAELDDYINRARQ